MRKGDNMKTRTIEELHDKDIGHRKMAKIADILLEKNYEVSDIREYNEQFKFKVDGYEFQYLKEWKSSAKEFVKYLENILDMKKHMERIWKF